MPGVTVRDLSAKVIKSLKRMAKRNGRSMEAEIRAILEQAAMDRQHLLDLIEKELADQNRPTTAEEVNGWISVARERPPR